ncbi:hypothetical protein AA958_13075 [Streptomyces sp. CNQ-509]|uniref:hypothetical protein n=1 Tax=Streptomyces sp. CNQ-509 TaxID=444103 RepID=UPI00062DE99E|nr:hypothetical protein [Streptomyces sp. CNQ-509]AKH83005.1 hypothetical protein AA958_13075 [Streptomyces sp. CNQ-509]
MTAADGARKIPYAFSYRVPDEFVRLPEAGTLAGWDEALGRLMPDADEDRLAAAGLQMRRFLPLLSEGGETTVLTAMCAGTEEVDGDERLSMGLLAVSAQASDHDDQLMAAEGIYRAKEQKFFAGEREPRELDYELGKGLQGTQDMLLAVKLPGGPGVMSASLRSLTLPGGDAETPAPVIPFASLQLIMPAPRGYCAYVTIATPSVFLLDSYCMRLAHVGRTFGFDVPAGGDLA